MSPKTQVTARDLMRAHVLTLTANARVQDAIEMLESNEISGAPVLDRGGRLVGFLSLRDIARSEHVKEGRIDAERRERMFTQRFEQMVEEEPLDEDVLEMESFSPEALGGETVEDWMNPEIVSIEPDASLKRICRTMIDEGVHRVLVVEKKKLLGIITTTDIVRHLAEG